MSNYTTPDMPRLVYYGRNVHELILENGDCRILFSYETPVAAIIRGRAYITQERYGVTTSKHISRWKAWYSHNGETKRITQRNLNSLLRVRRWKKVNP